MNGIKLKSMNKFNNKKKREKVHQQMNMNISKNKSTLTHCLWF